MNLKRSYVAGLTLAALFITAFNTTTAQAEDANKLVGKWNGFVTVNDLPQPINVDITDPIPGKQVLTMTYTLPRNCVVTAQYGGQAKGEEVFYISSSNTGWCHSLQGGHLKMSLTESGKLKVKFKAKSVSEAIILER
jgi:hypothetical protein